MKRKNDARNAAPIPRQIAKRTLFDPARKIPNTTKNIPTAERIAPTASKGRAGSAGSGSTSRRLSNRIVATTRA
jgi:hypothetical protein